MEEHMIILMVNQLSVSIYDRDLDWSRDITEYRYSYTLLVRCLQSDHDSSLPMTEYSMKLIAGRLHLTVDGHILTAAGLSVRVDDG